jgi:hypothetical protein
LCKNHLEGLVRAGILKFLWEIPAKQINLLSLVEIPGVLSFHKEEEKMETMKMISIISG